MNEVFDIFVHICSYLSKKDIKLLLVTCKKYNSYNTEELYRNILLLTITNIKLLDFTGHTFSFKNLWNCITEDNPNRELIRTSFNKLSLNFIYNLFTKSLQQCNVDLMIFALSRRVLPYPKYIMGIKQLIKSKNINNDSINVFNVLIQKIDKKDEFIIDFIIILFNSKKYSLIPLIIKSEVYDEQCKLIELIDPKLGLNGIKYKFNEELVKKIKDINLLKYYLSNISTDIIVNEKFVLSCIKDLNAEHVILLISRIKIVGIERLLLNLVVNNSYQMVELILDRYEIKRFSNTLIKRINPYMNQHLYSVIKSRITNYSHRNYRIKIFN